MPLATGPSDVAEIQGLYGAFSFSEKLLQKIWLRGDFDDARALTLDGQRVQVLHPGKWNLLGGPDFKGARLRLANGAEREGDIELHLRAEDWDAHGHAHDPAYDQVILHVVLFWPPAGTVTRGAGGCLIPVLPLLPLLHHDLEAFAADEAVELLGGRPGTTVLAELAGLEPEGLRTVLEQHAAKRWGQKMHFAAKRVGRLGWEAACHHTALEVLGYRFNRVPMARLAGRWPLAAWTRGEVSVEGALQAEQGNWSVQGVRPANHPRTRLEQYVTWCRTRPTWPHALLPWAERLAPTGDSTSEVRRSAALHEARETLGKTVCGGALGGSRLDTLICDGLLPLAATRARPAPLYPVWFHWFCGDLPPAIRSGLRHLGLSEGSLQPACHGHAQGLLGWLIEREVGR